MFCFVGLFSAELRVLFCVIVFVDFLGREGSGGSVICFWQGRGFSGDSGFILAGFLGSGLSIRNQLVCSVLWLVVLCFFWQKVCLQGPLVYAKQR